MSSDGTATDTAALVRWDLDDDGVGRVTVDRPDSRNALTWVMRDRLAQLLEDASVDVRIRVVVIRGEGGSFCAGADLRLPQPPPPRPDDAPRLVAGEVTRLLDRGWQRLVRAIVECDKPVVAVVDGVAAGGGVQLALACDMVLASDRSRFVEVFVDRGIVPDAGAAHLLTRLVGPQRAKELLFLGDSVDADTAGELGLVNRVVPAAELDAVAAELVGRLAAAPTVAIAQTKRLVNSAFESDLRRSLHDEAVAQELTQASEDAKEGIAAFVERRDPDFRGH